MTLGTLAWIDEEILPLRELILSGDLGHVLVMGPDDYMPSFGLVITIVLC